jgi:predicted solute-binding protein
MAPVFHRLTCDVEEITGVPDRAHRMLVAGEIDIAPISSIAYARDASQLRPSAAALRLVGGARSTRSSS